MGIRDKGYHELVTENSVVELSNQEFNMLMLHELYETRDYLLEHYDLTHLDGIDQAEVSLEVYRMRVDYENHSEYSDLIINEIFEDEEFENSIDEYIANFESTY